MDTATIQLTNKYHRESNSVATNTEFYKFIQDYNLIPADGSIGAHKWVLSMNSNMFYTLFKVNISTDLPMDSPVDYYFDKHVNANTLTKFRDFMYFGVCEVDMDTFKDLLIFADRYECIQLIETFRDFFTVNTDRLIKWCNIIHNKWYAAGHQLLKIIALANTTTSFNVKNLIDKMTNIYFPSNIIPDVFDCDLFVTYVAHLRHKQYVHSEEEYLHMVKTWILSNKNINYDIICKLISCIKPNYLTPQNQLIVKNIMEKSKPREACETCGLPDVKSYISSLPWIIHFNWHFAQIDSYTIQKSCGISTIITGPQADPFAWTFEIINDSHSVDTKHKYHDLVISLFTIPQYPHMQKDQEKTAQCFISNVIPKYSQWYSYERCYSIKEGGVLHYPVIVPVGNTQQTLIDIQSDSTNSYGRRYPKHLQNGDIFTVKLTWEINKTRVDLMYNDIDLGELKFNIPPESILGLKYTCNSNISIRPH